MKKEKLSLKNIKNVLSKAEMKKIMAGSGGCGGVNDHCGSGWGDCCGGLCCGPGNAYGEGVCNGC